MKPQRQPTRAEKTEEAWRKGLLRWKLHAGQKHIYDKVATLPSTARQVAFICGRRFGKSYLTLVLAIEACLRKKGARVLICAPYIKQVTEITTSLMPTVTADAPKGLIKRHRSTFRWNFSNGSVLMLSGLDLVAETIRGTEFDAVYLEEDGSAAPEDFLYKVDSVLMPTLLKSRGKVFHVTTLSRVEDHPLHTHIMPKAAARGALFLFPTTECPLYDKAQLDEMCKEVGGEASVAWRREFLCHMVRDEELVAVPEWSDDCVKEFDIPMWHKPHIGGDFGGVRDKTALLLLTYDYRSKKVLVVDELVFSPHTPSRVIMEACHLLERQWKCLPGTPRFIDAPGQLQVDFAFANFPAALPQKDDFEASINFLRSSLKDVLIHPRCKETIACLRFARLNPQRTDFARTKAHGHADALMALVYGLRHVNRMDPFPLHGGADPSTHYIPVSRGPTSESAIILKSLFLPPR